MKLFVSVLFSMMFCLSTVLAQDVTPPELSDVLAFDCNHVDLFFNEEVDSLSATALDHYVLYAIHNGRDLRTIPIDSSTIEESHISVRLHTGLPLSAFDMTFRIATIGLRDIAGNTMVDTSSATFNGIPPVGFTSWNDPDNYVIEGHVMLADGTPVTDFLVPIQNNGPDNESYMGSLSSDDIDLKIRPDETGWFRVEGLPSQPNVNMSDDGLYSLSVWNHPIYEPYGWDFSVYDSTDGVHREIHLYPVVDGTGLEGIIHDPNGQVIPFEGYSSDDVVQITRGDVSVWTHPPNYTDSLAYMYYNPVTGAYHAQGDLAGGDYDVAFFLPGTGAETYQVNIPSGGTGHLDVSLIPVERSPLLPIEMDTVGPLPTPSLDDTITLSWQAVDDPSIVSYVVGIWHDYELLHEAGTDSFWTRISPTMLHVAVLASDTTITLTHMSGLNMEIVSPDSVNVMSVSGIGESELFYWGVFASDTTWSELNPILLEDCFSGKPAHGLKQLISPKAASPFISFQMTTQTTATVTIRPNTPPDAIVHYRVVADPPVDQPFLAYTEPFDVEVVDASVTIEAFASLDRWISSDTVSFVIQPNSGIAERGVEPQKFEISSVYPNPFNPTTTVTISLPEAAPLQVDVFNLLGQKVVTLADGSSHIAGLVRLQMDEPGLATGVYFVHAYVPGRLNEVRKIILLR